MTTDPETMSEAGPSTLTPGPTPYHETSQFRHWRYSSSQLDAIRAELNTRSVEVFKRNSELEKVRHLLTSSRDGRAYDAVNDRRNWKLMQNRKHKRKWVTISKHHLLRPTSLSTMSCYCSDSTSVKSRRCVGRVSDSQKSSSQQLSVI